MGEEIIIDIELGGKVTIEVNGVKGKSCTEITKQFIDALGGTKGKTELKRDYHDAPYNVNRIGG